MKGTHNLREGPIASTLLKLTLPIIATNLMSTTYGLVDMLWIGRLGSGPVAAVGTAIFFIHLAAALFTLVSMGTGVKIAQSIGAGREDRAKVYFQNGVFMALLLGVIYLSFILFSHDGLIGTFDLGSERIEQMASWYLLVSVLGSFFMFFNTLFSVALTSMGNSSLPFRIQVAGFLINLLLDPLLIFGMGDWNGLGVTGAAFATVLANVVVFTLFIVRMRNASLLSRPVTLQAEQMWEVLRLGLPITVQRVSFIVISILIAKLIVEWGADAIAAQRVGIQIESISFMTIGGLQGAIAAFIGQNYGAKQVGRMKTGYQHALLLTSIFGLLTSILFVVFPKPLFSLFLHDDTSLAIGIEYMKIIGCSQLFMCVELMTVGAFNGIGKTYIPPISSILLTALRIPLAWMLSGTYGLNGIWMAIAWSSVLKGLILVIWFMRTLRNMEREQRTESILEHRKAGVNG